MLAVLANRRGLEQVDLQVGLPLLFHGGRSLLVKRRQEARACGGLDLVLLRRGHLGKWGRTHNEARSQSSRAPEEEGRTHFSFWLQPNCGNARKSQWPWRAQGRQSLSKETHQTHSNRLSSVAPTVSAICDIDAPHTFPHIKPRSRPERLGSRVRQTPRVCVASLVAGLGAAARLSSQSQPQIQRPQADMRAFRLSGRPLPRARTPVPRAEWARCRSVAGLRTQSVASSTSPSTSTAWDERVLSGIQPTGIPHLGNFCGAIAQWVALQEQSRTETQPLRLYSVVDLHAITVPFDHERMPAQVRATVATLLGAGLDPTKNILFKQSDVREHTELAWLLSCITPIGWLQRMTQYKQKAEQGKVESALGLLAYPVLMAADILLYRATQVPVGHDQLQHLELARMIATTCNDRFQRELFPKPFPVQRREDEELVRIMSLREPTKKMSKSDASAMARIDLSDDPVLIRKKIMKAQTDATAGISYDKQARPGVANLLSIFSAVTDRPIDDLVHEFGHMQTGVFKQHVADAVIAKYVQWWRTDIQRTLMQCGHVAHLHLTSRLWISPSSSSLTMMTLICRFLLFDL